MSFTAALLEKTTLGIASKLLSQAILRTSKQVSSIIKNDTEIFTNYLSNTYEKCSKLKTIIDGDRPVELLHNYVHVKFKCNDQTLDDYELIKQIWKLKKCVISGFAGGGKSIFMKYLWISIFENPEGKIPVFLELRRFNEINNDDFLSYMHRSICFDSKKIDLNSFKDLCYSGLFYFIFDGFDEIKLDKRHQIEKVLIDICSNSSDTIMVVSGRPDEKFKSWQQFTNFYVKPLDMEQTISLVEKIDYNLIVRQKFVSRIKNGLFDTHESFLSSPLLVTMMLRTFNEFADIPEKIHIFYEQAFDTLFSKHDATKEAFNREKYSNLGIDTFKSVFGFFCLLTYKNEATEFSDEKMRDYVNKAIKLSGIDVDCENFIRDLLETVNLIHRDGLLLSMIHRSIQEYFTAYCLDRSNLKTTNEILIKFSERYYDNVLGMLFDMRADFFEPNFVIPELEKLVKLIKQNKKLDVVEFIRDFLDGYAFFLIGNSVTFMNIKAKPSFYIMKSFAKIYKMEEIDEKRISKLSKLNIKSAVDFRKNHNVQEKNIRIISNGSSKRQNNKTITLILQKDPNAINKLMQTSIFYQYHIELMRNTVSLLNKLQNNERLRRQREVDIL